MSYGKAYTTDENFIYTYGIEYYLAEHCNLSCKGCSESSPFAPKKFSSISEFEFCLQKIKPFLRPDRISFLGGEPLLHPEIIDFVRLAKNSKIFNRIILTTNGILLKKAHPELWQLLDAVEISIYPANYNSINKNIALFLQMAKENNTELSFYPKDNFNHILFSTQIPNELVKLIYNKCFYKNYCHTLNDKKFYKCAPSASSHHYLSHFNSINNSNERDYINLENTMNLREELINFLDNKTPLNACNFCAGSSGTAFQNEQLSKNHIPSNEFNKDKLNLNG